MERYIEMKSKQSEDETASWLERRNVHKLQITPSSAMDVTKEEKVKTYSFFKIPENREIFLSACEDDLGCALCWLRSEMA